jgi:SulP family sulfate permease
VRNGGTSPLAGVTHTLTLVAVILFLAPLAQNIPLAALAAILFVVAYNMSEIPHFVHILLRAPRADGLILVITFLLTVFADLVVAVNVGVILATLQFLRRMAASVEVQSVDEDDLKSTLHGLGRPALPKGILVYEINGPFFFGAVESLERMLLQTRTDPKVLILRLRLVPFMDFTGLQALQDVVRKLWKSGVLDTVAEGDYADDLAGVLRRLPDDLTV